MGDSEDGGTLQQNDTRRSSTAEGEEEEEEILGEESEEVRSRSPRKILHDNCSSSELLLDSLDEEEGSGSLSVSELLTCDSGVDSEQQLTAPNTASIDIAKKKSKVEEMVEKFQLEIERSLQQEEEERLAIESRGGRLSRSVSRSSLFLAGAGGCSSSGIATDSPAPSSCLEDNYAGPLVESLARHRLKRHQPRFHKSTGSLYHQPTTHNKTAALRSRYERGPAATGAPNLTKSGPGHSGNLRQTKEKAGESISAAGDTSQSVAQRRSYTYGANSPTLRVQLPSGQLSTSGANCAQADKGRGTRRHKRS